jgi:hypothetical protein
MGIEAIAGTRLEREARYQKLQPKGVAPAGRHHIDTAWGARAQQGGFPSVGATCNRMRCSLVLQRDVRWRTWGRPAAIT